MSELFVFDLEGEPIVASGRLHVCSVCKTCSEWSDAWSWFGSYKDLDEGTAVLKFCSAVCADKMPVVKAARALAAAQAVGDKVAEEIAEIEGDELVLRKQLAELKHRKHLAKKAVERASQ